MEKSLKKGVILYSIIVVVLVVISILNHNFWKFGIKENKQEENQVQQLQVNNVTYNVPYEEQWLD
ncbi:MAG: hypothetical protein IJH12_03615 [Clostridia bacterium]|nr:hypothetical protein [Clostridia bacterium]